MDISSIITMKHGWSDDLPRSCGWYSVWFGYHFPEPDDRPQAVLVHSFPSGITWAYSEADDPEGFTRATYGLDGVDISLWRRIGPAPSDSCGSIRCAGDVAMNGADDLSSTPNDYRRAVIEDRP